MDISNSMPTQFAHRLQRILYRYRWRTPVVVAVIASQRLLAAGRRRIMRLWLQVTTSGYKGNNIRFGRNIEITVGSTLTLGGNLNLGSRCIFEISVDPPAIVSIGSDTWISHDCHFCSYKAIEIGKQVLIGEFVSIRDTTHDYSDAQVPISKQSDIYGTITIEDDVWIGRGTLILGRPEGVVIGRGAVIGANSVVSHSVPPYSVVAGTPAKVVKKRGSN